MRALGLRQGLKERIRRVARNYTGLSIILLKLDVITSSKATFVTVLLYIDNPTATDIPDCPESSLTRSWQMRSISIIERQNMLWLQTLTLKDFHPSFVLKYVVNNDYLCVLIMTSKGTALCN